MHCSVIDGYNSFYYDGPGLAMETAIIHDLIPFIDKTYNTLASKEGRIIGGISHGWLWCSPLCSEISADVLGCTDDVPGSLAQ